MKSMEITPCSSCPRRCGKERTTQLGVCLGGSLPRVAKVMLHPWEEPFLCGDTGAGAIFFSGCNLGCVYCQNWAISQAIAGREMTAEELIAWMFRLKEKGAVNIELVTPTQFSLALIPILKEARAQGLNLPMVWNSSAYESVATLKKLEGLVDIYLPDFKYLDANLAQRWSGARDYPAVARLAVQEMVRQTGPLVFQGDVLHRGTVVRHLVLPGQTADSQSILAWLHQSFGHDIFISIMNQYTPAGDLSRYPELQRRVSAREYDEVVDFALCLGIENALLQGEDSQSLDFTPDFSVLWEDMPC